jgi:hypothetical protein
MYILIEIFISKIAYLSECIMRFYPIWISAGMQAVLIEVFHGFPELGKTIVVP